MPTFKKGQCRMSLKAMYSVGLYFTNSLSKTTTFKISIVTSIPCTYLFSSISQSTILFSLFDFPERFTPFKLRSQNQSQSFKIHTHSFKITLNHSRSHKSKIGHVAQSTNISAKSLTKITHNH